MRFVELPIVNDPHTQGAQTFIWRSRKGLIKTHPHWAQSPDRQQFYFRGPEIVSLEAEEASLDWTQAFASYYGLWSIP